MLPPGESRWVCTARSIEIRKKTGQTDGRTSDRYITLITRHGKRNNLISAPVATNPCDICISLSFTHTQAYYIHFQQAHNALGRRIETHLYQLLSIRSTGENMFVFQQLCTLHQHISLVRRLNVSTVRWRSSSILPHVYNQESESPNLNPINYCRAWCSGVYTKTNSGTQILEIVQQTNNMWHNSYRKIGWDSLDIIIIIINNTKIGFV